MPSVRRISKELLGDDFLIEPASPDSQLLSTIKVPKNLLYLTDRLPKPHYDHSHLSKTEAKPKRNTQKVRKEKPQTLRVEQSLPEI